MRISHSFNSQQIQQAIKTMREQRLILLELYNSNEYNTPNRLVNELISRLGYEGSVTTIGELVFSTGLLLSPNEYPEMDISHEVADWAWSLKDVEHYAFLNWNVLTNGTVQRESEIYQFKKTYVLPKHVDRIAKAMMKRQKQYEYEKNTA